MPATPIQHGGDVVKRRIRFVHDLAVNSHALCCGESVRLLAKSREMVVGTTCSAHQVLRSFSSPRF
jgi:hypothetical protein